ncbi:hypothetical protein MKK58_13765 [Methylobacterium sp. J-078]|uniref:hypothetical protein n=1 Tax=Methylobacterium sp. J-078 TaxID=2836657 RepID=UPI001FBBB674|nr:hypothetical protein [Methylobacterium sp. J-078]MCJ2045592.1 hypothetical protein [Methylobacterium sp. J-078]
MSKPPTPPAVRFRVDPAYVPADKAARRMGLTLSQFTTCCPKLYARGFPAPDETTGMFDIEAMDRWRKRQRPDLYPEVGASNPEPIKMPPRKSMGERFAEAQDLPTRKPRPVRRLGQ